MFEIRPEVIAVSIPIIFVLGAIGLFILLIAGVNYINLTTAAASSRIQEIGIKQSGHGLKELAFSPPPSGSLARR